MGGGVFFGLTVRKISGAAPYLTCERAAVKASNEELRFARNDTGVTFSIRKARPDDADFVLALFKLPHVHKVTHGPPSIEVFLNALDRSDRELLTIERNGRPFGHLGFAVINGWLMEIRVIAFEEQRTGAGRFTMEWLLHRAFDELGLHRVFLEVLESNVGAQVLYESVGFIREGCYCDGFRDQDGSYHNLLPYGLVAVPRAS